MERTMTIKKFFAPSTTRLGWQQWFRNVWQRLSVVLMLVMLTTVTAWAEKVNLSSGGITVEIPNQTYTGNELTPEVTVKNGEDVVNEENYTVTWSDNLTNAGNYTITITAKEGSEAYEGSTTATFTINKAPLTITANNKSINYGDAPANDGVTYEGFVNNEDASVLVGTLDYGYTYTQYSPIGNYEIMPSGLSSNNYNITFKPGTLTVDKKSLTVAANDITIDHGAAAPAYTYTVTGLVNGESLTTEPTLSSAYTQGAAIGTYPISISGAAASANYTISYTPGTLTVQSKKYTVTFQNEDGTQLQSSEVEWGETPAYTGETPTKAATAQYTYTFAGWSPAVAEVTEDATYTATYSSTAVSYTINYVLYGGTNNENNPTTYTCESDPITLADPTAPENSGYTFGGWYTDANFENSVDDTAIPQGTTGEMTFYAEWLKTLTATAVWADDNNKYGVRDKVTLFLSDGTDEKSYTFDPDTNPLTFSHTSLPVHKNGEEIVYTWRIRDNSGCYEQSAPVVDGNTTTFTLTLKTHDYCGTDDPKTTDVDESKTVTWNYNTSTKTITIAGSGPMMYYNSAVSDGTYCNGAPWRAYAGEVEHVVISDGITYVGSNTFAHCPNISSVTLPTDQHLYEIGPGAFGDCTSLTSIDIPMSVNKIDDEAFAGCSNLSTVTLGYGDGATFTIGTNVFPATTTIIVPLAALQSYYNATSWVSYKTQLAVLGSCGKTEEDLVTWMLISNGSVMVDLYGQDENSNLVKTGETTVPAYKLTISGTGAMADYTNSDDAPWMVLNQEIDNSQPASFFEDKKFITELEIGAGITALGADAFTGLTNLKSLTIADGSALTTIAPTDFAGNLTTVSLPTTVTTIDLKNDPMVLDYAINYAAWHAYHERFSTVGGYCGTTADNAEGKNLSWTLAWNGQEADDGSYPLILTIEGTGAMADYTITNAAPWSIVADVLSLPEGLTYIGTYAFTNCNFATVTIPASVTYINDRAFERGAKAVTFAENSQLKTLYGETFQYCDLTSVTIPASVTTIGAAFENCSKLEHVTFAEGTEPLVMGETFCSCTSLETIDIPARVTNIINGAFNGCINLKTVTMLGDTPPTLGESTSNGTDPFAYCTSLSVILVPNENAYAAYKSAPTWNGTATGTKDNKTDYTHLLAPTAITLAGNTSGWSTYCHNYIVSYSVEGGAAYTVSGINDSNVQTAAAQNVAPYTPTLVYKENGGNVTLTAIAETATQDVPTSGYNTSTGLVTKAETGFSMLGAAKDAPVSGSITAGYSYALFDGEFLKIDDSTLSIPAHRCILTLPEPLSASRLSIVDGNGEATSLTPAPSPKGEGSGYWYTLDGRKLDKQPTTKGLYIYKGKKVVIK